MLVWPGMRQVPLPFVSAASQRQAGPESRLGTIWRMNQQRTTADWQGHLQCPPVCVQRQRRLNCFANEKPWTRDKTPQLTEQGFLRRLRLIGCAHPRCMKGYAKRGISMHAGVPSGGDGGRGDGKSSGHSQVNHWPQQPPSAGKGKVNTW